MHTARTRLHNHSHPDRSLRSQTATAPGHGRRAHQHAVYVSDRQTGNPPRGGKLDDVAKWRPKNCRACGAGPEVGAVISKRGFCGPCGVERAVAAAVGMANRSGPHYEAWQASQRAKRQAKVPPTPARSAASSPRAGNRQRRKAQP